MKYKSIFILMLTFFLSGCYQVDNLSTHIVSGDYIEGRGYLSPMNTIVSLKMYNQNEYKEVVSGFDDIVKILSKEVDRYYDYNNVINVKTINDSCGSNKEIKVSDELFEMIELGISLTKVTKGKFNLAMGNLIDLYKDILNESHCKK